MSQCCWEPAMQYGLIPTAAPFLGPDSLCSTDRGAWCVQCRISVSPSTSKTCPAPTDTAAAQSAGTEALRLDLRFDLGLKRNLHCKKRQSDRVQFI